MRLSEAIRLGAMLNKRHGRGGHSIQGQSVCALGGAADAIGLPVYADGNDRYLAIEREWPELIHQTVTHPIETEGEDEELRRGSLRTVIWSLNDAHLWTREQIANFVQSVEPQTADVAVGEALTQPVAVSARP